MSAKADIPGGVPAALVRRLMGVIGAVILAVSAMMVVDQARQAREEPWRSPELAAARIRLHGEPRNEELKLWIRDLDLQGRLAYFQGVERNRRGGWILLTAGVAFVLLASEAFRELRARQRLVIRSDSPADRQRTAARARVSVMVAGGATLAAALVLGLTAGVRLPDLEPAMAGPRTPSAPVAPEEGSRPTSGDWARQWPRFLGPEGNNVTSSSALPLRWDVATGEGVAWRADIPLPGYNSPVVWEDRVFLTGGNAAQRLVYCFEAATGALVWSRPVRGDAAGAKEVEVPDLSGPAASTVATDGERVFAIFATGELGALDFSGATQWNVQLDLTANSYGHASSLVVWQDRLFVQMDQGHAEDGKSQIQALDTRSGKVLWKAVRPVSGSWTTPVVMASPKPVLIVAGEPFLMAYDPAGGEEWWRADLLGGELAPSPLPAGDLIVVASPGHALMAVRTGGKGDVTATHVVWSSEDGVPDIATPVAAGDLLFTVSTSGQLVCRQLATGETVWEHELDMEVQATPLVAGDRLYLFTQTGEVRVVQAGREFKSLAAFAMNEEIYASPAVAGERLVVRTKGRLYGLAAASTGSLAHAP